MYTRRLLMSQKKKQIEYWKSMLEDLPVLDMPLDHMRPSVLSSRGARIPVRISSELTSQFTHLLARANSNLFVGLLSLYMSLLHVWGGGERFCIGVAMANRQHGELFHLIFGGSRNQIVSRNQCVMKIFWFGIRIKIHFVCDD